MPQRWRKLGLVFGVRSQRSWMRSHASLPVPVELDDGNVRVFFSTRDAQNRSSIAWVDVALHPDCAYVLGCADLPVLAPGSLGTFDDAGVSIGCVIPSDGDWRLYYMGWNVGGSVPWRNSIGMAVGDVHTGRFERFSIGPIMDRSPEDPYTLSYPWVIAGRNSWTMWYGSHLQWSGSKSDMSHAVKRATSDDGIQWRRRSGPVIGFRDESEYAIARPCVILDGETYRAWFACRGGAYRLGYAESRDGIVWERRDELVSLEHSSGGWDGQMICYPCVFRHRGAWYLFYNGNDYGSEGFGVAVLD